MLITISRLLLAALYIAAGVNHFVNPKFYIRLIPHWLPLRPQINIIVGIVELLLGILVLIPATSKWAAWGVIILLIAIFPAHIYDLWGNSRGLGSRGAKWLLWLRLPIQFLLIAWAYVHTQ